MPDFKDILWHLLNFIILFIVLRIFVFKPVSRYMQKREDGFTGKVTEVEQREQEVVKREEKSQNIIDNAKEESAAIASQYTSNAQARAEAILADAQARAKEILEKARRDADEKQRLIHESIRNEAAVIAVRIAERVLKREVNSDDTMAVVQEFVTGSDK